MATPKNVNNIVVVAAILITTLIAATAWADLYKYTDEKGRIVVVNNAALVPHRCQPQVIKETPTPKPTSQPQSPSTDAIKAVIKQAIKESIEETENQRASSSHPECTPIILYGNQVIVPTTLCRNRRRVEVNLLLDTGAAISLLDRKAVKKLKLKNLRSSKGQLADGSKIEIDIAKVQRLEVGPKTVVDVPIAVVDRSAKRLQFDGLLGMNVLKNWNYRIDYQNSQIVWE